MKAQLRMSEAALLVGVSPSTLRAWESAGLGDAHAAGAVPGGSHRAT